MNMSNMVKGSTTICVGDTVSVVSHWGCGAKEVRISQAAFLRFYYYLSGGDERTGNTRYRDKIMEGLTSMTRLPDGIFTGNKALGYDPASGRITYEGPAGLQNTNHLATIMGGFEVMNELLGLLGNGKSTTDSKAVLGSNAFPTFEAVWLDHALHYKEKALSLSGNRFPRAPSDGLRCLAVAPATAGPFHQRCCPLEPGCYRIQHIGVRS